MRKELENGKRKEKRSRQKDSLDLNYASSPAGPITKIE